MIMFLKDSRRPDGVQIRDSFWKGNTRGWSSPVDSLNTGPSVRHNVAHKIIEGGENTHTL